MAETKLVERARPKVNLTLRVLGRRSDGYHALESLVAFAREPADTVTLTMTGDGVRAGAEAPGVRVGGPQGEAIVGENLLARVLRLAREMEPRLEFGTVDLEKHLPVAAGIGGGSADAAALIRALRRGNGPLDGGVDWHGLALRLGADVPVCLDSQARLMWGVGEKLSPVLALPMLPAVIVNPMVAVPADKTAQVFRRLGAGPLAAGEVDPRVPVGLSTISDVVDYMLANGNDLTEPATAVVPAIEAVLRAIGNAEGCRIARLSGGGPTCFGLFDTEAAARSAAQALASANPTWWVVATALG